MRRHVAAVITVASMLLAAAPARAQVAQGTFTFRGEQVGSRTPLGLVVVRTTASFSSVNGAGDDFRVEHDFLAGNAFDFLLSSANGTSSDLFIRFNAPLSRVRLHVGLDAPIDAPQNVVTITRFIRTASVGSTTTRGVLLPGGRLPEVTIEVGGDGRVFDGLSLASPATDMALAYLFFSMGDPVTVVPEPAAPWLLAVGAAGLALVARRRRPSPQP